MRYKDAAIGTALAPFTLDFQTRVNGLDGADSWNGDTGAGRASDAITRRRGGRGRRGGAVAARGHVPRGARVTRARGVPGVEPARRRLSLRAPFAVVRGAVPA